MEANKGVYALLLGSGLSSSAGIPTGWGILKELCYRLMIINGENDNKDELEWYREKYGKEPKYDNVIESLAKTSTERLGLLEDFFVASKQDVEQNIKVPTKAHRSIAKLVQEGYIKVIITTNFDRLIEQALEEINVEYQSLYHETDFLGMKPLTHANCTIIKVHGDYRDTRFKNITEELTDYPIELSNLLKQIFSDYGLIISGWSSEWDTALRETIKSVEGRRYSWFWHLFSEDINEKAKELINFRDAHPIVDKEGADHFFNELSTNVLSIYKVKKSNPETLQIKVEKLKKYIFNENEAAIRDLITYETKLVSSKLNELDVQEEETKEVIIRWINEIKEITKPISVLMAVLSYYSKNNSQEQLIIDTLERFTGFVDYHGKEYLKGLKELPIIAVLYSVGISLVMNRNYNLLNKVFTTTKVRDRVFKRSDFLHFTAGRQNLHGALRKINSYSKYPIEDIFTYSYLNEIFAESTLILDEEEYEIYFDLFEFLRALKYHSLDYGGHYATGMFGSKPEVDHIEKFLMEGFNTNDWEVLVLFEENEDEFKASLKKLVKYLEDSPDHFPHNILQAYLTGSNKWQS